MLDIYKYALFLNFHLALIHSLLTISFFGFQICEAFSDVFYWSHIHFYDSNLLCFNETCFMTQAYTTHLAQYFTSTWRECVLALLVECSEGVVYVKLVDSIVTILDLCGFCCPFILLITPKAIEKSLVVFVLCLSLLFAILPAFA